MANNFLHQNRSDRLAFQIYNQILTLVHDHGLARSEKLSALSLSEKLGVSRTPVNFVLSRLELEGLILGEEKGGWIVSPLSVADLDEIFDIKERMFPLIVELAAKKITPDNNAKLLIFVDELARSLKRNDVNSWRSADKGYNTLLEVSAGNRRLSNFEQILDNQLYRLLTAYLSLPNNDKEVFSYYQEIASAVTTSNETLAREKALQYVAELRGLLKKFLQDVVIPLLGNNSLS